MNPLHLLGLLVVLFILWLALGNRNSASSQDKFVKPTDSLRLDTYDKAYPPDEAEKEFYRGYFE